MPSSSVKTGLSSTCSRADILTEYLCLYRVLEAADGANGTAFPACTLADLPSHNFGDLRVVGLDNNYATGVNAFEVYRSRAEAELASLAAEGTTDLPRYLYALRNGLAHG
jgi:hypothetical protein